MILFKIITLFPEFFKSPMESGLLGKAVKSGIIEVDIINLRDHSRDRLNRCDDYPFGGGSGMVLKPEPLSSAIESTRRSGTLIISASPGGRLLKQDLVKDLAQKKDICIVCGNYEGIDQRIIDKYIDYEISVGDYILSGGEFAALLIIDAVSRYVPGFMSNSESLRNESFERDLLEYPQYTRPHEHNDLMVPEILLSGNHKQIEDWRMRKSIEKTKETRPDLYKKYLMRKIRGE